MLRVVTYGFKEYFSVRWNRIDFILLIVSVTSVCLEMMIEFGDFQNTPYIVLLRFTRLLRLLNVNRLLNIALVSFRQDKARSYRLSRDTLDICPECADSSCEIVCIMKTNFSYEFQPIGNRIARWVNDKINERLTAGYDIGRGFEIGQLEVRIFPGYPRDPGR